MLLACQNISKAFGTKEVLKDINFHVNEKEKIAIVGINGSGKTTLLKIIMGEESADSGQVVIAKDTTIGYLSQHQDISFDNTIYGEMLATKQYILDLEANIRRLEQDMKHAEGEELEKILETYNRLSSKYDRDNGYSYESEITGVLKGLGFGPEDYDRHINTLSGGQKMRIALGRLLLTRPDIIILDEPTSFLDIRHKLELLAILRRMAKEKGITVIMSLHEIDLAQKISDKIICVKGDAISHFGAPETIFREDIIRELYEIDNGSFDPCFGSIELPRPEGTPRVFVLAGGGTGIPVFRKLQKENVPFAAGVLYTNDIDYQLARILAMETVTEAPFQEISDEAFARACELMKSCERVIDTGVPVGMCNRRIEELRAEAKRLGKLAE